MSRASPPSDPASTAVQPDTRVAARPAALATTEPRSPTDTRTAAAPAPTPTQNPPRLDEPDPAVSPTNVSTAVLERGRRSPAATAVATAADQARPTRSLNVQHILNPTQSEAPARPHEPWTAARAGSPSVVASLPPPHLGRRPYASFSEASGDPGAGGRDGEATQPAAYGQGARRILMPRSPALRAASLGRLSLPSNVLPQPGPLGPPMPGASQASDVPPLPTPPSLSRWGASYGFPAVSASPAGRRASAGPLTAPLSQSASPSTSYSSHGPAGHPSPAPPSNPNATQPPQTQLPTRTIAYDMGPYNSSAPPTPHPYSSLRAAGAALPPGQQQMLTLNTGEGPIEVPLDVQAASKMADDRRKRNAGASARFRQRRKEKEREASQTIAKLEQRIRDVSDERDFYRQERDHFQRLVLSTPGHAPLGPRPLSPARRRSVQGHNAPAPETEPHPPSQPQPQPTLPWPEAGGQHNVPPALRRRSSAYAGPPYALPPPQAGPAAAQPHGPVPMGYGPPNPAQDPRGPAAGPGHAPPPVRREGAPPGPPRPTPEQYDPYAPERYDRGWYLQRPPR